MDKNKLAELALVFKPKSIAVVGASKNKLKPASRYLQGLIEANFKGKLYPVNPNASEVSGLKTYPNLRSILEPVDYVAVFIPRESVLELLDDCAVKKVKAVSLFTAGFSELDEEGSRLEQEMLQKAHEGGFRIIGPNCLGIYSPAINMSLGPEKIIGEAGHVAFISQSGSLAAELALTGIDREIHFSHIVSFGNGSNLDSSDFLEYLAIDPETKIFGFYLEGTKDGKRLFQFLKETSKMKPVILWKAGRTKVGAEIAFSHTGALAASNAIWSSALRQAGAIQVDNFEELADTFLAFQQLPSFDIQNVAVLSGLAGGGGGESVSAADACISSGLNLPPFQTETRGKLQNLLGEVGSILRNPLDLSQSWVKGFTEIIERVANLVASEPHIDLIIIQENVDVMVRLRLWETILTVNDVFAKLRRDGKPIVAVLPPAMAIVERAKIAKRLSQAQIPVFPSIKRATRALANVASWKQG